MMLPLALNTNQCDESTQGSSQQNMSNGGMSPNFFQNQHISLENTLLQLEKEGFSSDLSPKQSTMNPQKFFDGPITINCNPAKLDIESRRSTVESMTSNNNNQEPMTYAPRLDLSDEFIMDFKEDSTPTE